MPQHEFGIMDRPPQRGESYEAYEPEAYHCIPIDDGLLSPALNQLKLVKCYWHTLDRPEWGLAYYGVTLIPPGSLPACIEAVSRHADLYALTRLLMEAAQGGHYVIHFGI